DLVSMVSNLNLAYLHMRLEYIFSTDEWFVCKYILLVGASYNCHQLMVGQ
uniref:Uncharacterized protein n=1 Tax=Amphimedon queenslandica TaxID=400682 RepID=A0A1X7V3G9_AMPQE